MVREGVLRLGPEELASGIVVDVEEVVSRDVWVLGKPVSCAVSCSAKSARLIAILGLEKAGGLVHHGREIGGASRRGGCGDAKVGVKLWRFAPSGG